MRNFSYTLYLMLCCSFTYGAEVDHFYYLSAQSDKKELSQIQEITAQTNQIINVYLKKLSTSVKSCKNRKEIFSKAKYIFDTNFPDVTDDLKKLKSETGETAIEKQDLALKASTALIYGPDFKFPFFYNPCCVPVVKLGESFIGIDKIDHFLSHGFMYFKTYSEKKILVRDVFSKTHEHKTVARTDSEEARMKDVFALADFQEESSWGLSGTGVKSYGDLSANYAGLQFYKNLIDGENPYLRCEGNKLIVSKEFKIQDYVDSSWNESINCSSFNSVANRDATRTVMKKMGFEKCPIAPEECKSLVKKYKDVASHILHPLCFDPTSTHNQVEKPRTTILSVIPGAKFINIRDLKKAVKGAK